MRPHPVWIHAKEIARWKTLSHDWPMRALVCRLDDPVLAPLLELAPTQWDVSDSMKPLAGKRAHFLERRALLRKLVSLWAGCAPGDVLITHDAHGAPRVVAPDVGAFASTSSRGVFVALAVGDAPVGVDIEITKPAREPVWHVLHAREKSEIEVEWRRRSSDHLFIKTWIAKEAYLKALGTGLMQDPATVAVEIDPYGTFDVHDPSSRRRVILGLHDDTFLGKDLVPCACVALD